MTFIFCWLVIHSSRDGLDNRQYVKVKGTVLNEYSNSNKIDFHEAFEKMGVDMRVNPPIKTIPDNECMYK